MIKVAPYLNDKHRLEISFFYNIHSKFGNRYAIQGTPESFLSNEEVVKMIWDKTDLQDILEKKKIRLVGHVLRHSYLLSSKRMLYKR